MKAHVKRIDLDFDVGELDNEFWDAAEEVRVDSYWSGQPAPVERHFSTRLLWSDSALYVRFQASLDEPLIIRRIPNLDSKSIGLWDRDVCEIFVASDPNDRCRYVEIEVAPNGEWVDLEVHQLADHRETDWNYESGMKSVGLIESDRVTMAARIPWTAFSGKPKAGDIWHGNLFRCVGSGPGRGYLAWSPTYSEVPNFHVPERFGEFRFVA